MARSYAQQLTHKYNVKHDINMFVNIPNVQHEELTHPAYSLALSFFKGSPVGDKSNYVMEKVG